jgi:hypothetical protein
MLRVAVLALVSSTTLALADEPPAIRYAAMSPEACVAELTARQIPFEREDAKGVLAPVRLKGPLRGVEFRTNEKAEQRETSIWEIADCRLVLAMDDFAAILAEHDIVQVRHYSMYRRPPKRWPDDKLGTQHRGALALDAARFIRKDGSELDVLDHFKGRIGSKSCGENARKVKTPDAIELRAIVCAAVDRQLFNVVLTPNYNRGHRNHFHLEVTPGVKWFMVR